MVYPAYSCLEGPNEELAEEIIQKTSGILSVIGAGLIFSDVLQKLFIKNETNGLIINWIDSYQRIMLGLSFFDIMYSIFASVMWTWMTPKETGWLMAIGNQATCTAQGFFVNFGGMGVFGYQIALSLNILLLIAFGWSQERFARTVELPIHISIITASLAFGIVPLPLASYNPSCGQCGTGTLEYECNDPAIDGELCIVRGNPRIGIIYWKIFLSASFSMIIFCTIAMIWVYIHVRKQENRQAMYGFPGDQTHDYYRESRRIRKILLLYTLALYVCWGIPFVIIFIWSELPFGVRAVLDVFVSLSGFFNMLVYFLPNCLKYQKSHPGTCLVMSYWHILIPQSTRSCSWCSKLFKKVISGNEDATIEEVIMDSPDMNFAAYNTSLHNIGTHASLNGDRGGSGSGNESESENQAKENTTAIAIDIGKREEAEVTHIRN